MLEPVLELSPTPCAAGGIVLPKSSKSLSSLVTANTVLSLFLYKIDGLGSLERRPSSTVFIE
jgi:hypothetical protein